jgi:membrane-bound metal-dependent hydrolase YbcI (DUF457 family)
MPFTPFHFGPSGLIGQLLLKWVDFPTILIASVVIDIEPLFVILFNLSYPLHGFFHSFLGATLVALLLILIMRYFRRYFSVFMKIFKLKQDVTLKKIALGAFIGLFAHILLDAPIYVEMNPFFPIVGNPFLVKNAFISLEISIFCIFCFLSAILIYCIRLIFQYRKRNRLK